MNALTAAIVTKAAGSSFMTAIGSRLRNGRAEDAETYPYCVFLLPVSVDPQSLSSFTEQLENVWMQFSIFSSLHSPSEAWTINGYLETLYDDCILTVAGHTFLKMERRNTVYIPEDHTVEGTQRIHHVAVDYGIVVQVG